MPRSLPYLGILCLLLIVAPPVVADGDPLTVDESPQDKLPCVIIDVDNLTVSIVEDCWEPVG